MSYIRNTVRTMPMISYHLRHRHHHVRMQILHTYEYINWELINLTAWYINSLQHPLRPITFVWPLQSLFVIWHLHQVTILSCKMSKFIPVNRKFLSDSLSFHFSFKKSTFRDNLKQCTPIKPNQKDVKAFAFKSPELENTSDNNMISANVPSKTHLHLDLDTNYSEKTVLNGGTLTCPSLPAALLPTITPMSGNKITADLDADPSEIRRLMGAVSFGYGIFQLCSSLLPTKILKIFNFLGFVGVQSAGIACLMFSRTTNDVRSIMAT